VDKGIHIHKHYYAYKHNGLEHRELFLDDEMTSARDICMYITDSNPPAKNWLSI
jgi:hypothetical protein